MSLCHFSKSVKQKAVCQAFLSKKPSKKTQGQKLKRKKLKKLLSSENAEKMSKRPEYAVCCVLKCSTITTDPTRQQRCDVSPGLQWSFGPDLLRPKRGWLNSKPSLGGHAWRVSRTQETSEDGSSRGPTRVRSSLRSQR